MLNEPSVVRETTNINQQRHETKYQLTEDEWTKRVFAVVVQRKFELLIASGFGELMDNLGQVVPGSYDTLKPSWDYLDSPGRWDDCSPDDLNPSKLHVVAQHHGCPTRLLDFTANPLAAAFFAADTECGAEQLAVWALKRAGNKQSGEDFNFNWGDRCNPDLGWRVVSYPRASSPFLHAQSGLFATFDRAASHYYEYGAWPSLDGTVPSGNLRKLTLPRSEVPELTRLLWIEGVSRAHLMPTLDSISTSLNRIWTLDMAFRQRTLDAIGTTSPTVDDRAQSRTEDSGAALGEITSLT